MDVFYICNNEVILKLENADIFPAKGSCFQIGENCYLIGIVVHLPNEEKVILLCTRENSFEKQYRRLIY